MSVTDSARTKILDHDSTFEVEEIVQCPLPGYGSPTAISFSPDDSVIAYLYSPDYTLNRKLYTYDPKNGEHELLFSPPEGELDENTFSAAEKLRRERLRERGLGVTRYEWLKTSFKNKRVMVPLPAGIYIQDRTEKADLKISSFSHSPIMDAHVSPDGTMIAYVRDNELHVLNLLKNMSKQLTVGAKDNAIIGLAEYIAQEEMDRKNGSWWSLDSKLIAFTEVDSSEIPLFRIMHPGKTSVGLYAQEDHAYPFAGCSNAKVRLGVVSAVGGPVTWMDLLCGGGEQAGDNEYLARVNWMHGNTLIAQSLNRTHSKIKLINFDLLTGQGKVILEEENETWINLHECFTPLDRVPGKSCGGFIWASEKSGFRHLYVHDIEGVCLGSITEGPWMVDQVAGVNEASGIIYITGTFDGPLECHLYSTNLFPDANRHLKTPLRLTQGQGRHTVVLDHQLQRFVDVHDSLDSPPRVTVRSLVDGTLLASLYEYPDDILGYSKLKLEPPEIIELQADDGTSLYGALYKPDATRFGPPPYKTMVQVYGGPGVQLVCDSWINTVDMRAQYLRSKGILVWKMDNRGTARRGLEFSGTLKHKCGHIEIEDQLTGVKWLINKGFTKARNIGLYGWSYGGYLTAMAIAKFSDTFRCAIAGAPVTSWDGYDTFYSEKYMGMPSENQSGYLHSSVMHHIEKMEGKLLLIHGMIDENVHFRHTARLINALVAAGKPYDLLIFPDERHTPRCLRNRVHMEQRIWEFIERNL